MNATLAINSQAPHIRKRPMSAPITRTTPILATTTAHLPGDGVGMLLRDPPSAAASGAGSSTFAAPAHRPPPAPAPPRGLVQPPGAPAHRRPPPPAKAWHAPVETQEQLTARVLGILRSRTRAQAAVRPLFSAMDEDRVGGISHDEFVSHLRKLGFTRETDAQLAHVARAIDASGAGTIRYEHFANAMVGEKLEDGTMRPELRAALAVVQGTERGRAYQREFPPPPGGGSPAFPSAPHSLRGGASALDTKYAWSEWGGVPIPSVPPAHLTNAEDAARAAQAAAAAERPGQALRVAERAEARARRKVQTALDAMRSQVEMHGSIAAAFRKLEVSGDAKISGDELRQALKSRFNIEMSEETTAGVLREFDANGDGEIEYKEFVAKLLGGDDIDTSGGRGGAKGAGGVHVEITSGVAAAKARRAAGAGAELSLRQRHDAAQAMGALRQRLLTKHSSLRDAFRSIDVDSDGALSYEELGTLVGEWMPELPESRVRDVCRLLDADGDGEVSFDEFASTLTAKGDDMRASTAGLLRAREQKALQHMVRSKGRFGATPAFSYGVQVGELLASFPGAAGYQTEAARFGPSVGHQLRPEWQVADAARKAQRADVRREQMRFHLQRGGAVAASRQRAAEDLYDARLESRVAQRTRWQLSVANENRSKLHPAATFRC